MMVPGAARANGMPLYKIIANRFLTGVENRVMGTELSDLHTGYRAYSRRLLLGVPFLRNASDFSFDSEMLMQASALGIPARRGAGDEQVLRRRVLDRLQTRAGVRTEDALGGRPAGATSAGALALAQVRRLTSARRYQPSEPGSPLNGPSISSVIQPP